MQKRVLVGMSGGVDSTFAAYQLKQEGYEVIGVYMKLYENEVKHKENIRKIDMASKYFGIEYKVYDLTKEFNELVYSPFINSYVAGDTPNPCGNCNQFIKFGKFVEVADELGCEFISTGHYINTDKEFIYEADDDSKDQTYFLFHIDPKVLKKMVFPLGGRIKDEIKEFIRSTGVLREIADQKESTEICFVETDYKDLLRKYVDVDKPGDILDSDGNIIGRHKGYMNYTIGQRKGFETTLKKKLFVNKIIPEKNQIVVGEKQELRKETVKIKELNLFFRPTPDKFHSEVRLRYRTKKIPCLVEVSGTDAVIHLEIPAELGVAKGQAAVFYDGNKMIGGGWIV